MARRCGLVCGAVVCTLLAACGGGTHGPDLATVSTTVAAPAPTPTDTARLVCNQNIDIRSPGSTGLHTVLGVVALPTAPGYEALQTSRTGMHGRLRLFAKTGLVIKPRTRFELRVPAALTSRMAISWGNAGGTPPRSRFVVDNCGRGTATGSRWLVYAGGYYVSHPACVPLEVVADGRRARVRIGLGTACPGQRPPLGPTQS